MYKVLHVHDTKQASIAAQFEEALGFIDSVRLLSTQVLSRPVSLSFVGSLFFSRTHLSLARALWVQTSSNSISYYLGDAVRCFHSHATLAISCSCCTLMAAAQAKTAGGKCLVHCLVGASRSVSICLAYMVTREGMSLRAAYAQCKAARPVAKPNRHFCTELMEWEAVQGAEVGGGGGNGGSSMTLADFGHR
jgi:hypothetical protein